MQWLVASALVLLFALVFNLGLLAYAMYVLLGVMLTSRVLAQTWARNVTARREWSALEAEIGDTIAVVIELENTSALPIAWLLVEDLLPRQALLHDPPNLGLKGRRVQLQMLKGHGRKWLRYQLKCNRRGYYQLGPLVAETGDLFGLHRRFRSVTDPDFLLVYPRIIPLEGFEIASRRPIGEVRMSYRLYEDPTRIAGVRAYQAGDPLNRIHWHATARTGSLHSKIYEPSTVAGATVLMDLHQESHPAKDEPFRSELAVTAAASVATNGRDAADRIRVEGWDFDPRTRQQARQSASMLERSERLQPVVVPTRRGSDQLRRILETLARVELTDGLQLHELILEAAGRMPRDATVITILPQVTTYTVVTLQSLKHRGFAVSAILNLYHDYDFAVASGPLQSIGVDTHHLKNEESISGICQRYLLR
jgi:uncharacterized protein (DUF58 family)